MRRRAAKRRRTGKRVLVAGAAALVAMTGCSTPGDAKSVDTSSCRTAKTVSGTGPWSAGSGWSQVLFDDFDRCELGDNWSSYDGKPGGNPIGEWNSSMVEVADGVLRLKGEQTKDGWRTGGVSNYPVTQLFGRWEVRMRAEASADLSYHALLWPKNEQWPPEIDFAESVSSKREAMSAFVHWKAGDEGKKASASTKSDFTQWHTVGVEWMPGVIKYLLDGKVWAEVRSWTAVPSTPMWLGLQVEAGSCERRTSWGMKPCAASEPRPKKAAIEIDWVSVSRPSGDIYAKQDGKLAEPTPGAIQLDVD